MVHVNGFLQENYDRVRCAFRGNVVGNKICLHSSGYYENVTALSSCRITAGREFIPLFISLPQFGP
jgi:hypothetical protein